MKTISTLEGMNISGDVILLMDDVTTTGNSLYACREILLQNGYNAHSRFCLETI